MAGGDELDARIAAYELAYRMQSAAVEVGQLNDETTATTRVCTGWIMPIPRRSRLRANVCLARRLVERGVRMVQVYDMAEKTGWDAHDTAGR